MLTPKFSLSQDADFVYIDISVPHIKLSEADCYVTDDEFYFFSEPYYLRLHLSGEILDDASASKYDPDSGSLTVRVSKKTKGEMFTGLDMLTKLLTPKSVKKSAEIEVISVGDKALTDVDSSANNLTEGENEAELDWFIEQEVNEEPNPLNLDSPKYGFAGRKSNTLNALIMELPGVIDLIDADNVQACQRSSLRQQQENDHFSCEHYLADLFDDEQIQEIILLDYPDLTGIPGEATTLSETEKEKLLQLPRREYIIENQELRSVYLGLVDLMFAYAYDFRFRQGEPNTESDWTICKLSATLSWLDSFENIKDVLVSSGRRCLIFPLYRSWTLFQRILSDVRIIFNVGQSQLLKCLLDIHKILSHSDIRYPLNDLYITDYCVWIQGADSIKLESVAKALAEVNMTKSDLNLKLEEMEADARNLIQEQPDSEEVKCDKKDRDVDKLASTISDVVRITETQVADSDDDENESEESSGSSDDESDSDTSSNEENGDSCERQVNNET